MSNAIEVRTLLPDDIAACEAILGDLPDWFGIPEANTHYIRDLAVLPGYVAQAAGEVLGFLALQRHNPLAAEIHVLAVHLARHRRGIGRALVAAAESDLRREGVRLLQVKTLGPSRPDEGYARTRAFYEALGFVPLEELDLWGPENPALVMVKPLV